MAVALLALLGAASPAAAQVEVTATLDLTDGWARPGTYVPVRLRATNRTGVALGGVHVRAGGPVDVAEAFPLAPDATGEIVVPVFYVGGDLGLQLEFVDEGDTVAARTRVAPASVRTAPSDAALVALVPGRSEPDEAVQRSLREALDVKSLQFVRMPEETLWLCVACAMLDAVVADDPAALAGRAMLLKQGAPNHARLISFPFPLGVAKTVQPETLRLFAASAPPAEDRSWLWTWLAVVCLAVLATGAAMPRRWPFLAAAVLVVLAGAATAVIWFFGDIREARVLEARVFYVQPGHSWAAIEQFTLVESRGGATAQYEPKWPESGFPVSKFLVSLGRLGDGLLERSTLPLPLAASSEDLFRRIGTLAYAPPPLTPSFATHRPRVLLHALRMDTLDWRNALESVSESELEAASRKVGYVAALLVRGDQATDAAGRTQTIDAWSVEWKTSDDDGLAYAGRSLAWWDKTRREGDKPALLAWYADPASGLGDTERPRRLPALIVYAGL